MRIKTTVGGRRRTPTAAVRPLSAIPFLSTAQDEQNATLYDTESDHDDDNPHVPVPDFTNHPPEPEPESEPLDLLDENICISCNKDGGTLLICSESGCPVSVHASCIGSEPKFDDSRNFYCPYCWYKRTVNKCRELKEKAVIAKKALSSFLDKPQTVRLNDEKKEEKPLPEEPALHEHKNPNQDEPNVSEPLEMARNDNGKGKVSVATGSSVSETKDSDSDVISVKKGRAKRKVQKKVASEKKPLSREHKTDELEQEVTSSGTLRQPQSFPNTKRTTLLTGKRKRLHWTVEEERALKEGVLKFSVENQKIPWRKILEFGYRVFDETRTPVDLKDKWKNISSKEEGCNSLFYILGDSLQWSSRLERYN